jgi:hypothetical protein
VSSSTGADKPHTTRIAVLSLRSAALAFGALADAFEVAQISDGDGKIWASTTRCPGGAANTPGPDQED